MKTEPKRAIQTGLRIPVDLLDKLDALRRQVGLTRTEIIVAALRAHLNAPAPAETIGRER